MSYFSEWDKGTLKFPEMADIRIDSKPLTLNVATADLRKLAEPRATSRPKVELREHLDPKRLERQSCEDNGKGK